MRLALITREYPPITTEYGGIGRRLATVVAELTRTGHVVDVFVRGRRDASREIEGAGVHTTAVPASALPLSAARWGVACSRRVRRHGRYDVVLAPNWGGDAWYYARHKAAGPLVTNLTASLEQMRSATGSDAAGLSRAERLQRRFERSQIERSDGILAVSRAALTSATQSCEIEGISATVLPNPIDVERIRQLAAGGPLPRDLPVGEPFVAFSGPLERLKGVEILVEAMCDVWTQFPEVHLVFAGRDDGGLSRRLKDLAGERADKLHILGQLERPALFATLSTARVVACPSLWEASSNAALEAMALGCPAVLTEGSGFDEFCADGEEGLLVAPGDGVSLAAALRTLLGDAGLRARLGEAAACRVARDHAVAPATRRYADFLESVSSVGDRRRRVGKVQARG